MNNMNAFPLTQSISPSAMTPFYILHIIFLLLLLNYLNSLSMSRGNYHHSLVRADPFPILFLPLICCDLMYLMSIWWKWGAQRGSGKLGSNLSLSFGMLFTKLFVLGSLKGIIPPVPFVLLCMPQWVAACVYLFLRCRSYFLANNTEPVALPLTRRPMFRQILTAIFHFTLRGLQPLLLVLRLDKYITCNWFLVALPAWLLVGIGVVLGSILLQCSFSIHQQSPQQIRTAATRLLCVSAFESYLLSLLSFDFVLALTQRLNYQDGMAGGCHNSYTAIIAPLLAMLGIMLVLFPVSVSMSLAYQVR